MFLGPNRVAIMISRVRALTKYSDFERATPEKSGSKCMQFMR